jgi:hypothetical protein
MNRKSFRHQQQHTTSPFLCIFAKRCEIIISPAKILPLHVITLFLSLQPIGLIIIGKEIFILVKFWYCYSSVCEPSYRTASPILMLYSATASHKFPNWCIPVLQLTVLFANNASQNLNQYFKRLQPLLLISSTNIWPTSQSINRHSIC